MAIVVVPARLVPRIFEECIRKDIKRIVLITAGFKKINDPRGAQLHEILEAEALMNYPTPERPARTMAYLW